MSKFQLILLIVFGLFIVVAVGIFSFTRSSSNASVSVTVWGDISNYDFNSLLSTTGLNQDNTLQIKYVEISADAIEKTFTEALATGVGPDLIILPLEKIWKNKSKLVLIPFSSVNEGNFKSTFVEEAELLLAKDGIYALPLSIDPMVLYYNRDLLTRASMALPVAYWDEMYNASLKLTQKDRANNVVKSTIALGDVKNIPHFKDILSLLLLQAGTPITQFVGGELRSALSGNFNLPVAPSDAALDFYTQFSNPAKAYYSWNRSLLPAQTHFISGDSAYYLGFASEYRELKAKNPTLNLGVAPVPQSRVSDKFVTFGKLRGIALTRGAKDAPSAFSAAMKLVSKEVSLALAQTLFLPPPRRDLLATRPTDSILSVFYDAALQSKGWLDPDDSGTASIFSEMIESVTSGRARTSEATMQAGRELDTLIKP